MGARQHTIKNDETASLSQWITCYPFMARDVRNWKLWFRGVNITTDDRVKYPIICSVIEDTPLHALETNSKPLVVNFGQVKGIAA